MIDYLVVDVDLYDPARVSAGREGAVEFARSQRVPALAVEVGVTLTTDECKDIYNDRSALVHGSGVDLSVPHDLSEFGGRFNRPAVVTKRDGTT